MNDLVVDEQDPALEADFIQELVRQVRAVDSYGMFESYSDARVLDPFVLTPERKKAIPVVADPDEIVISRVTAYYNAIATATEKRTGYMTVPVVSISHEGFGRVMITTGKLVVLNKPLRDVHRFGFPDLASLVAEAEGHVDRAAALVEEYPQVAAL